MLSGQFRTLAMFYHLMVMNTLISTQRLKGRVTKTMSQEMPKRIHPQTPMLWFAFSSAAKVLWQQWWWWGGWWRRGFNMSMSCLFLSSLTNKSDTATRLNKIQQSNKNIFSPYVLDFFLLSWVGGQTWYLLDLLHQQIFKKFKFTQTQNLELSAFPSDKYQVSGWVGGGWWMQSLIISFHASGQTLLQPPAVIFFRLTKLPFSNFTPFGFSNFHFDECRKNINVWVIVHWVINI